MDSAGALTSKGGVCMATKKARQFAPQLLTRHSIFFIIFFTRCKILRDNNDETFLGDKIWQN